MSVALYFNMDSRQHSRRRPRIVPRGSRAASAPISPFTALFIGLIAGFGRGAVTLVAVAVSAVSGALVLTFGRRALACRLGRPRRHRRRVFRRGRDFTGRERGYDDSSCDPRDGDGDLFHTHRRVVRRRSPRLSGRAKGGIRCHPACSSRRRGSARPLSRPVGRRRSQQRSLRLPRHDCLCSRPSRRCCLRRPVESRALAPDKTGCAPALRSSNPGDASRLRQPGPCVVVDQAGELFTDARGIASSQGNFGRCS